MSRLFWVLETALLIFFLLLFFIESTDVEGYINFISSPRKSKWNVEFFKVGIV